MGGRGVQKNEYFFGNQNFVIFFFFWEGGVWVGHHKTGLVLGVISIPI